MREKLLMDTGWKFYEGDFKKEEIFGHQDTYMQSKAERGRGPASRAYYDTEWKDITLPHDFVVHGEYKEVYNGNHGSLKRNNAWYRRYFKLEEEDRNKRLSFYFEGLGTKSKIWVNGHLMGQNDSMYNSFEVDFTAVARIGEVNTIAIYIDNSEFEGWWYEGGGIYRYIWLQKTENLKLNEWENYIRPIHLKDNSWSLEVEGLIESYQNQDKALTVEAYLIDKGRRVAFDQKNYWVENHGRVSYAIKLTVEGPVRWDIENPYLYEVEILLKDGDNLLDRLTSKTGFRTIEFSSEKGFILNDKVVKLKGSATHQDHGPLGVAVPYTVEEFRIRKLKEMGCNAYRCAHNNPTTNILSLSDELGMVVIDENRWFETSEEALRQVTSMVKRDRNHPSVIIWSLGNEEPIQGTEVGKRVMEELKAHVGRLDKTRPTTLALNAGFYYDYASTVSDVLSINYAIAHYEEIHKIHPNKCIMITEAGATTNTRGVYFEDERGRETAYDEHFPLFGSSHRTVWEAVNTRDYIAGMFIWTGIEYRGEAPWPKLFYNPGGLDSCCFEKDNFYLFQALWCEEPVMHIMPHWNLEGREGENIRLYTYTNVDEVELWLNGKLFGKQEVDYYNQNSWNVPYEPGELIAIGYKEGKECIREIVQTTKKATTLTYKVDNITPNQEGVGVFRIYAEDEQGNFVPDCTLPIRIDQIKGGEILGIGNGDGFDHTSPISLQHHLHAGLCQIIVRQDKTDPNIELKLSTKLGDLMIKESLYKEGSFNHVEKVTGMMELKGFRMWPLQKDKPNVGTLVDYDDMNTSIPVDLGRENIGEMMNDQGFLEYSVQTNIPNYDGDKKVKIILEKVTGPVEVFVAHDKNFWPSPMPKAFKEKKVIANPENDKVEIELDGFRKKEKILINILSEVKSKECGLNGRIYWEISN